RSLHSVVLLDDGRVLIAGGDENNGGNESAEVYNPTTNTFMLVENLEVQARAAAKLRDGRVLMIGDFVAPIAFVFEPDTNSFAPVGDMNNMHAVFPTATALPDGRVLVAGGCSRDAFATDKTDIFDPDTDTFSNGPTMTVNRDRHVAMLLPDGLVLLIGGMDNGEFHANGDLFDPSDNTITRMSTQMSTSRVDFAGVALIP
ncbi:MAG: Kelch repeat-containing protein, partial [Phycisphaerae bacterium]